MKFLFIYLSFFFIWFILGSNAIERNILRYIIGYDVVVLNWVISFYSGKGYFYNVVSKELFNIFFLYSSNKNRIFGKGKIVLADKNRESDIKKEGIEMTKENTMNDNMTAFNRFYMYLSFKVGVMLTSLFLFFTSTTLVAFTLKETQVRFNSLILISWKLYYMRMMIITGKDAEIYLSSTASYSQSYSICSINIQSYDGIYCLRACFCRCFVFLC
jgi:hypothetical protein